VIELGEAIDWPQGADDFRALVLEMAQRYSLNDFSPIEVEITGRLERKSFRLIFRRGDGTYIGNGFGQNGGLAAILRIKSIRRVKGEKVRERAQNAVPKTDLIGSLRKIECQDAMATCLNYLTGVSMPRGSYT
jgi:hypothetical protein